MRDCDIATWQVPLPAHAPTQFMNTLPLVGFCVTVIAVLSANALVHVPVTDVVLSVQASPDGELVSVPPPCEPVAALRVSVGGAANCAVTLDIVPVAIGTVHVVPEHAPVYAENDDRPEGVDVSVTIVFGANVVVHVPPVTPAVIAQLIPAGLLVTRPLPVPPPVIVMPCV